MKRFEYMIFEGRVATLDIRARDKNGKFRDERLTWWLNMYGNDGWELISVIDLQDCVVPYRYLFKREIQ